MNSSARDDFHGEVVLVIGAASGIGRAAALRFAARGATVVAADISSAAEEVAEIIVADGGTATAVIGDLSERTSAEAAVAAAVDRYGRLDVVANIAGVLAAAHSHETTDEQWDRIIAINLTGVFYVTRAALPHLLETKGRMVMAASTSSLSGHPWMLPYSASKGAILSMTRTLAMEYARRGLRINAVAPGGIETPLVDGLDLPADGDFTLLERISPLDGFRGPESVAGAIVFLASHDAEHVNGEVLRVDGGTLA